MASEFEIQCYVVTQALRKGILVHGDPLGLVRSARLGAKAKCAGARKGWPDLTFVLPGRVVWVELKTTRGKRSADQKRVHKAMAEMGHSIWTVFAKDGPDGWEKVQKCLLGGVLNA